MKKNIIYLLTIVLLASCVTPSQLNYMQKPSRTVPDYADTIGFKEYRIQSGDYLNIVVHSIKKTDVSLYNCQKGGNLMALNGDNASSRLCSYLVEDDGNIDYPYLGEIYVKGKTIRELKYELEDVFYKDIAKYVSVDVYLANRSFSVIGESGSKRVNMPTEKITIFQALAMIGDLSMYADRSNIKLVRSYNDSTVVKEFDLRSEKIIDSEYYYIQPNDVLYVQYSFPKYVGITHISNAMSVTLSTASFGLMLYRLVNLTKESIEKQQSK
ncbi:MAG: hypothetical protein CSA89_00985 [Bacteroidales bacterium]|nr:MAG: hypothetical protein CSA89_00985 [Bacteroidales bacterium]